MNSIYEYIFNDVKEIFTGKINTSKENSNYYDIIDSPSCKVKDSNLIMIPKLIINKNNKRNHFNELIDVAYNKLKIKKNYNNKNNNIHNNDLDNNFYHEIFYFYKNNKTNNLATKIYTIFPNVNFEFTQIKNLSFSNTNLNKYLINSKFKLPEMENNNEINKNEYNTGFFTMSQNHRLIALKDDIKECGDISKSQSLKEIIFGIWINLKDEKPSPKKADLDFLFNKNKLLIFKECFRFIQLSNNIETIYSPSPEENIFLLVIFYKGMQCHYEVKLILNNEEKNPIINNNNNCWLISKCKYDLNEQKLTIPFDFDIKIEINNGTISTMADYLNKKTKNNNSISNIKANNKEEINENQNLKILKNSNKNVINIMNENNNENAKIKEIKNDNNNLNNNLLNNTSSDVFDLSDYDEDMIYGGYNYPLAMQNINNINKNYTNNNISKNNQNKNEQNIIYKNKQHEISRASTNAHSNKPSLSSSKNSGKNNNSNVENINHNNEEENNINDNSFEIINQYTSIIMKNSESIKKLQNQVNNLEKNILEIINQLENEEKKENKNIKIKKDKKKKEKKEIKVKNEIKEIKQINEINHNDTDMLKSNIQDTSNYGDVSINVPRIIYKELSITKDDL